jgi:hypothetical protein
MKNLLCRRSEPNQPPAGDPAVEEFFNLLREARVMRPVTQSMPPVSRATWLMAMRLKLNFDFFIANMPRHGDPDGNNPSSGTEST